MKLIQYVDILSAARKGGKIFTDEKYILTPLAKEALKSHNVKILGGGHSMRKIIIAGNWKMNKTTDESSALSEKILAGIGKLEGRIVVICPPFTSLEAVRRSVKDKEGVYLGAQNLFYEESGAYTGEVSAAMLKSAGCDFVIIGHSERRQYFGETDEIINKKIKRALEKELTPIVCVGETLVERESQRQFTVVKKQITGALAGLEKKDIEKIVIAYEPVWAIGTGKTATPSSAQEMHEFIRKRLQEVADAECAQKISILYGGSMNPANVKGLLESPDIDGGLIGGASLKAEDFLKLIYYDA